MVTGGLVTSTLLTLRLLRVLHEWIFEKEPTRRVKQPRRESPPLSKKDGLALAMRE